MVVTYLSITLYKFRFKHNVTRRPFVVRAVDEHARRFLTNTIGWLPHKRHMRMELERPRKFVETDHFHLVRNCNGLFLKRAQHADSHAVIGDEDAVRSRKSGLGFAAWPDTRRPPYSLSKQGDPGGVEVRHRRSPSNIRPRGRTRWRSPLAQ